MVPPLKHEVFHALARPRLLELAATLRIAGAERYDKRALVALLASTRYHEYRGLLRSLSLQELREVCTHVGMDDARDDAEVLVDRLLTAGDESGPPPTPPAPGAPPTAGAPGAPPRRRGKPGKTQPRGELGFEATLWQAADKLRSNMDAAEYKHVVLGLVFLKFVSEALAPRPPLHAAGGEQPALRGFWVPPEARWDAIVRKTGAPDLGRELDAAMAAIEHHNPDLRGVLPQIYQRPGLDAARLGELVHLLDGVESLGSHDHRSKDVLGRVYEYFLTCFASAEGRNGGQFYTPRSVVKLLVAMLAPTGGSVYDPACGSGGMFVQSERFLEEHGGKLGDLRVYGQESNPTTWRLAKMNLAIRGIPCDLGPEPADSFLRDHHPGLRADYVLANPPFNAKDWGGGALVDDPRWGFGAPPESNANFAWVQHFIHHMAPRGLAGFVLANGPLTSGGREGEIRRRIVEADLVDCVVALPSQLFYSTAIPVSLWILARDKADPRFRDRRGHVLMIDARHVGAMVDRTHRELRDDELAELAALYHAWRGDPVGTDTSPEPTRPPYADRPGRCRSVPIAELAARGYVLAPSRYIDPAEAEAAPQAFAAAFADLRGRIQAQIARGAELDREIEAALARVEVP